MRIGELAKATRVDVETIRYYERIGLLPAPARAHNGYRSYAQAHLERLGFIRHCRALDKRSRAPTHSSFQRRPESRKQVCCRIMRRTGHRPSPVRRH